jgi:tRNA U34 5-carboxymethylaminomethyl modifying enzyme MnmG/GidA
MKLEAKASSFDQRHFLKRCDSHIGEKNFTGGRVAEKAATGITEQLVTLGFETDRLKTGTPPRDRRQKSWTTQKWRSKKGIVKL